MLNGANLVLVDKPYAGWVTDFLAKTKNWGKNRVLCKQGFSGIRGKFVRKDI